MGSDGTASRVHAIVRDLAGDGGRGSFRVADVVRTYGERHGEPKRDVIRAYVSALVEGNTENPRVGSQYLVREGHRYRLSDRYRQEQFGPTAMLATDHVPFADDEDQLRERTNLVRHALNLRAAVLTPGAPARWPPGFRFVHYDARRHVYDGLIRPPGVSDGSHFTSVVGQALLLNRLSVGMKRLVIDVATVHLFGDRLVWLRELAPSVDIVAPKGTENERR